MAKKVLVVCTGNICRSPMGEQLLREAVAREGLDVIIDSAGVSSEEHGSPIDSRAAAALQRGGYGIPRGHARRVSTPDFHDSDLIIGMTESHYRSLIRRAEQAGADTSRIRLWREFDPAAPRLEEGARLRDLDIDDPWYGPPAGFDVTLTQLEAGVEGILDFLRD